MIKPDLYYDADVSESEQPSKPHIHRLKAIHDRKNPTIRGNMNPHINNVHLSHDDMDCDLLDLANHIKGHKLVKNQHCFIPIPLRPSKAIKNENIEESDLETNEKENIQRKKKVQARKRIPIIDDEFVPTHKRKRSKTAEEMIEVESPIMAPAEITHQNTGEETLELNFSSNNAQQRNGHKRRKNLAYLVDKMVMDD